MIIILKILVYHGLEHYITNATLTKVSDQRSPRLQALKSRTNSQAWLLLFSSECLEKTFNNTKRSGCIHEHNLLWILRLHK